MADLLANIQQNVRLRRDIARLRFLPHASKLIAEEADRIRHVGDLDANRTVDSADLPRFSSVLLIGAGGREMR